MLLLDAYRMSSVPSLLKCTLLLLLLGDAGIVVLFVGVVRVALLVGVVTKALLVGLIVLFVALLLVLLVLFVGLS